MGYLYDALKHANVDEEIAVKAAEEVANYDNRIVRVEADLTVLKMMVGVTISLQLITLGGMFGILWRVID